jgi:hypothetical protein
MHLKFTELHKGTTAHNTKFPTFLLIFRLHLNITLTNSCRETAEDYLVGALSSPEQINQEKKK